VSPERQLFLRINSEALFSPTHLLLRNNNSAFLTRDSYVELQQPVRHLNDDIRDGEFLGRISRPEAIALNASVQDAATLTPDQKRIIKEGLLG
jgi:hypothetical protein